MIWLITFQTLESDELVPLTTDLSDLIRALSDLCIQGYQQLLSITETRLQNIIGTTALKMTLMILLLLLLLSHMLYYALYLSRCPVGVWDHPRSVWHSSEAGNVQEASGLGPQDCRERWRSYHGIGVEGAGGPSHCPLPSGSALDSDGAGLPPAHLPHLCLRSQQPAAAERHVLLESGHADTVFIHTDIQMQHFLIWQFQLCFALYRQIVDIIFASLYWGSSRLNIPDEVPWFVRCLIH